MNSKIKVICDNCDKEFEKYPCRKARHNFCSPICYQEWQKGKEKLTIKKRQRLAREKALLVTCSYCERQFKRIPSQRMPHNFCSKECYTKWRHEIYGWKPKELRICKYCGREFTEYAAHIKVGDGSFCSMQCKTDWQRENMRGENHPGWKGGEVERICEICDEPSFIKPSHIGYRWRGRYCSRRCLAEARRRLKLEQWQDPEYRDRTIKASLKGLFKRPTSLERQFIKLIEKYNLPYQYTGDGSFLIGYKNPDFVNINGAKICIEVAEPYFHDDNYTKERVSHFAKYGWTCYVFLAEDGKLNQVEVLRNLGEELSKKGIEV